MVDIGKALRDLRQEVESINATIASLEKYIEGTPGTPAKRSERGRKSMGHEERLAVSERMKRYWAARRHA